jgi:hypothetical protein
MPQKPRGDRFPGPDSGINTEDIRKSWAKSTLSH